MKRTVNMVLLIGAVLALCSCSSHDTLKSPCPPMADLMGSPCTALPINTAAF